MQTTNTEHRWNAIIQAIQGAKTGFLVAVAGARIFTVFLQRVIQLPERALRPCKHSACPALTRDASGYCETHKPEYEQRQREQNTRYERSRGSAASNGYDAQWNKVRLIKLRHNPLCEDCQEAGRVTAAVLVHHVKPVKEHPELRLTMSNLRSLCVQCHELHHRRWGREK